MVGNAALAVTIPAGETRAEIAPHFEAISEPYNVQVVAWQFTSSLDGTSVLNPQAAYCITISANLDLTVDSHRRDTGTRRFHA